MMSAFDFLREIRCPLKPSVLSMFTDVMSSSYDSIIGSSFSDSPWFFTHGSGLGASVAGLAG